MNIFTKNLLKFVLSLVLLSVSQLVSAFDKSIYWRMYEGVQTIELPKERAPSPLTEGSSIRLYIQETWSSIERRVEHVLHIIAPDI